jgi:DNA-binding transcriptional MerR regulator
LVRAKDEGTVARATNESLLSEVELTQIERVHVDGLTSAQIIQIFQSRGIRLSEATFRKYVQLGLLPRSRRVGSKGKHRGSRGIYPTATVRRINSIKALMLRSFTIDEIQRSFSAFKKQIDAVESALEDLLKGFEREISKPSFDLSRRRHLTANVSEARRAASDLVKQLVTIENEIVTPQKSVRIAGEGILTDR